MINKIRSKRYIWLIAMSIVTIGLMSALIMQFVRAHETPATSNCEGPEVEMFRTQLALVPTYDTAKRANVQLKLDAWATMIAECENKQPATEVPDQLTQIAQFRQSAVPTQVDLLTQEALPTEPSGIYEGQPGAFFHAFDAIIENHWRGTINGNEVIVFAGYWVKDPDQGFISVRIAPKTGHAIWGNYPSPVKSGALRIVDIKGYRLIIQQAKNKNQLFFDVPSLSFVNSLDELVITNTPSIIPGTVQPMITAYPYPGP